MSPPLHSTVIVREPDAQALAQRLADEIAGNLSDAINERGRATLAVSGGSTPLPLFHRLRRRPLPWQQITVTLADERFVSTQHPDSNESMVRRELLQEEAAKAPFVGLGSSTDNAAHGAQACESRLADLSWPLDVVILGMGGDGHTASLFPALTERPENLQLGLDPHTTRRCIDIYPSQAPHARLSLTLAALVNCRRLILHITGDHKWRVLQQALTDGDDHQLPIRAVLRQARRPVEVFWAP